MAITQKTLVNQIEITEGSVQIRLELCVYNGDAQISSRWHRTVIMPDVDPAAQMEAVNTHLVSMGEQPVPDDGVQRINAFHDLFLAIAKNAE